MCHLVGVGGAVLREKTNELLIIKERVRNREFWKVKAPSHELLPTVRISFFIAAWR